MDKPQLSHDDAEASEKLFVPEDKAEIRPTSAATPQNGDTRIDLVEVRQAFVGMGKEELMKFANDPFWVRLRWSLFAFFVLLWFGMLAGAIAIIAYAPKCSAPQQCGSSDNSPLYSLNVDQIKDSNGGDISLADGLLLLKDHLKNLGVNSILLDLDLESSGDFKTLPKKYGSEESLKKALSTLKDAGIQTLLKIVPNHASINHPWFIKSMQKEEPYSSYFVWARGKNADSSTPELNYPNNWISYEGGSAWTWNSNRSEFYLHQGNASFADFNFRNQDVVNYFNGVFKFWLTFGFCGLHLEKLSFLVENQELRDELPSSVNVGNLGDYNFLTHASTAGLEESYDLINSWAKLVSNISESADLENNRVLSVDDVSDVSPEVAINFIQRPFVIEKESVSLNDQLKLYIEKLMQKPHQTWLVDTTSAKVLSQRSIVALNILFMLLPKTSVIPAGIEIGQLPGQPIQLPINMSASSNETAKAEDAKNIMTTFTKVMSLRELPSVKLGKTNIIPYSSLLLLTRLKDGNPGVLIAINLDQSEQTLALGNSTIQMVGKSFRMVAASKAFKEANPDRVSKVLDGSSVTLPPESILVLEFVSST